MTELARQCKFSIRQWALNQYSPFALTPN